MAKKIIVIDDNLINRQMLIHTLENDYEIIEADGGSVALQLIKLNCETLSAILTDIQMPDIDGYEVLSRVRSDLQTASIPVIMVTASEDEQSRVKALSLGANDFIVKPFNPEIIRHCLKNNIALRETASILNAIQKDKLTGLYNREAFFGMAETAIKEHAPGFFIMSCFDIDNFKLINDRFGTDEGDRVLFEIGRIVQEDMENIGGIGGRITGDNFAALIPAEMKELSITRILERNRMAFSEKQAIVCSVGRCVVSDTSLSASAVYDRAYIAKQSVKGRYDTHIAYFDDTMMNTLVRNQQITADAVVAVDEHQFEVWYQPQHNHTTGALVGAEALVRWRHPQKGIIPPVEFIPVFEKNGFIYELDKLVWEETCAHLRKRIDAGKQPVPVSVNVSRQDVFRSDFVETLTGLLVKYDLPVEMLRLEITESAFAESMKKIIDVVKQLVEIGFIVEIDDFGSGYSSLNTLKSVPAQIVKLDMRFLEDDNDGARGGNILSSVVRMTKWLGMSVIAEGVEEKSQADYLASIGCSYIQGYYYSKPLPTAEFDLYCDTIDKEQHLITMNAVENLDNNSFWDPKSMDTLVFSSYVGGACIFEYHKGQLELLRANKRFTAILGDGTMSIEDVLKLDWIKCLAPESRTLVRSVLQRSSVTKEEYTNEYIFYNIPGAPEITYLRGTMRVIATMGDRWLVYCTSENITAQREAMVKQQLLSEQIQTMMDDMPGGFVRIRILPNGKLEPFYTNNGLLQLTGMNRDEIKDLFISNIFNGIHPDDHAAVKAAVEKTLETDDSGNAQFRILRKDGLYIWVSTFVRITTELSGEKVLNAYFLDVTKQVEHEKMLKSLMDNMPCGAGIYEFEDGQMNLTYQNKVYWELVGLNQEAYPDCSEMSAVHPDDVPALMTELFAAIEEHRDVACEIRLRHLTLGYRRVRLLGRLIMKKTGGLLIYACFMPL